MDLIYTNSAFEDIGTIDAAALDMEIGGDNDFELTVLRGAYPDIDGNSLIYFDGTEYGGIVDSIELDTEADEITYIGTTWRGLLNTRVIEPDSGEDYYIVSGDANDILSALIDRLGLGDIFEGGSESSGITISTYQFDRYTKAYDGIIKMLTKNGAKLVLRKSGKKVTVTAAETADYSSDDYSSDKYEFTVTAVKRQVNHLICLGQGELAERTVVNLYLDADGNVSETQTFTGIEEVVDTYENTSCETEDELKENGKEELKGNYTTGEAEIILSSEETYDIGDIITVTDETLGISVTTSITKITVSQSNGDIEIECKIGG